MQHIINEEGIDRFIGDFNLKKADGIIGFAAKIKFHLNGNTKNPLYRSAGHKK